MHVRTALLNYAVGDGCIVGGHAFLFKVRTVHFHYFPADSVVRRQRLSVAQYLVQKACQ